MTAVSAHRLDFKANPSTNTSAFIQLSHRISAPISPYGTETANVSQNSIQVESLNSDRLQVSLSDNNSVIIDIDELPEEEIVTFKSSPEQLDLERPSMSLKNEEECEEIFVVSQPVGDAECPSFPGTESEVQESMTRYCTACHIDQPIRAKHCSECKRCVATFDHHCPFLGTCIGEKNRLVFYWYLFFQASEC